jgi:hypothetical protein
MRASSTITPRASASSGLISSSAISVKSHTSCDRFTSASAIASRSAPGMPRAPPSRRAIRVREISERARCRFSGGSASAVSAMVSVAVPPWPKTSTGPNCGSGLMPRISS